MENEIHTQRVPEQSVESSASGMEWSSITRWGAVGVSIILFALGSALGLSNVSPWSFANPLPTAFAVGTAVWLIVTQWLSAGWGGYLAGRLRKKWVGIRTDEVFFRDTAHGFLAWALATVLMAALFTLAATALSVAPESASITTTVSAETAEQARRATVALSFSTALSFAIGAFIGGVAGALGGYHRDETETMPRAPEVTADELDYVQIDAALINEAIRALNAVRREGVKLAVAKSCTGGLIATVLSEAPGAAEHFEGGYIVYTPEQKYFALNIPPTLIDRCGTVSAEVAEAMAEGELRNSNADVAVGVTGVAGAGDGRKGNPIGRVYFGCARHGYQDNS